MPCAHAILQTVSVIWWQQTKPCQLMIFQNFTRLVRTWTGTLFFAPKNSLFTPVRKKWLMVLNMAARITDHDKVNYVDNYRYHRKSFIIMCVWSDGDVSTSDHILRYALGKHKTNCFPIELKCGECWFSNIIRQWYWKNYFLIQ